MKLLPPLVTPSLVTLSLSACTTAPPPAPPPAPAPAAAMLDPWKPLIAQLCADPTLVKQLVDPARPMTLWESELGAPRVLPPSEAIDVLYHRFADSDAWCGGTPPGSQACDGQPRTDTVPAAQTNLGIGAFGFTLPTCSGPAPTEDYLMLVRAPQEPYFHPMLLARVPSTRSVDQQQALVDVERAALAAHLAAP